MNARVGLVGYNCESGLGVQNRQIAKYAHVNSWLIKPHPRFLTVALPDNVDCMVCPSGEKVESFLSSVDIVLFAETPLYGNLIPACKRLNKRIVCVPNQEWLPLTGWVDHVNTFLCPTTYCYNQFSYKFRGRCHYLPWPADTEKFQPAAERESKFLFINGNGGWHSRKGGDTIREVVKLWPNIPLNIVSQKAEEWPTGPRITVLGPVQDSTQLYSLGSILLCPHKTDGIGLEIIEAMASGVPVVCTSGEPWWDYPCLSTVTAKITKQHTAREINWYNPDPEALARHCAFWEPELRGNHLQLQSQKCVNWAESRSWKILVSDFNDYVQGVKS